VKIQIIGPERDPTFQKLLQNILHAIHEMQIDATVNEITNLQEISDYPLTLYPAVYINGKLVCQGKCITLQQVKECLAKSFQDEKSN